MTCLVIWIIATLLTLLPVVAEVASGLSGHHLWTLETVIYGVLPLAAIVGAFIVVRAIARCRSFGRAAVAGVSSVVLLVVGCAPLLTLATLLTAQEFTPPA